MFIQKKYWIGLFISLSIGSLLAENRQNAYPVYQNFNAQKVQNKVGTPAQYPQSQLNQNQKKLTIVTITAATIVSICGLIYFFFFHKKNRSDEPGEGDEELNDAITEAMFKDAIGKALAGNLAPLQNIRPKVSDAILNGKIYEDENSQQRIRPIVYIVNQGNIDILKILLEENNVVAHTKIPFSVCTSPKALSKQNDKYEILELLRKKMDSFVLKNTLLYAVQHPSQVDEPAATVLFDTKDCQTPTTIDEELLKTAHDIAGHRDSICHSWSNPDYSYFFKKVLQYTSKELLTKPILARHSMSMLDNELHSRFESNYVTKNEKRFELLLSEERYRDAQLLDNSEAGFKRAILVNCINTRYISYLTRVCQELNPDVLDKKIFGTDKNLTVLQYIHRHYHSDRSGSQGTLILQTLLGHEAYKNHLFSNSLDGLAHAVLAAMVSDAYQDNLKNLCDQVDKSFFKEKISDYFGNRTVLEYATREGHNKVMNLLATYDLADFDHTPESFKKIIEITIQDENHLAELEAICSDIDINLLKDKLWDSDNALDHAISNKSKGVIQILLKNTTYKEEMLNDTPNGFKRLLCMARLDETYLAAFKELRKKVTTDVLNHKADGDIFSETPLNYLIEEIPWSFHGSSTKPEQLNRDLATFKTLLNNQGGIGKIQINEKVMRKAIDIIMEYQNRAGGECLIPLQELVKHASQEILDESVNTYFSWSNRHNNLFDSLGQKMTLLEYAIMNKSEGAVSLLLNADLPTPTITFKSFCFAVLMAIDNPSEKVCMDIVSLVVSKLDNDHFFSQTIPGARETILAYVTRENTAILAILKTKMNA